MKINLKQQNDMNSKEATTTTTIIIILTYGAEPFLRSH
jgi:hypothetical protein